VIAGNNLDAKDISSEVNGGNGLLNEISLEDAPRMPDL